MDQDNSKYEARVRLRAEEMAHLQYVKIPGYKPWENAVKKCLPVARLAVQWEAEAYSSGFDAGYFDRVADNVTMDEWLQALGLIPSPNQQKP